MKLRANRLAASPLIAPAPGQRFSQDASRRLRFSRQRTGALQAARSWGLALAFILPFFRLYFRNIWDPPWTLWDSSINAAIRVTVFVAFAWLVEYREITRPHRLVFTWKSEGAGDTVVTIAFERVADRKTKLTLTHERFVSETARDGHRSGWGGILEKLDQTMEARL